MPHISSRTAAALLGAIEAHQDTVRILERLCDMTSDSADEVTEALAILNAARSQRDLARLTEQRKRALLVNALAD